MTRQQRRKYERESRKFFEALNRARDNDDMEKVYHLIESRLGAEGTQELMLEMINSGDCPAMNRGFINAVNAKTGADLDPRGNYFVDIAGDTLHVREMAPTVN